MQTLRACGALNDVTMSSNYTIFGKQPRVHCAKRDGTRVWYLSHCVSMLGSSLVTVAINWTGAFNVPACCSDHGAGFFLSNNTYDPSWTRGTPGRGRHSGHAHGRHAMPRAPLAPWRRDATNIDDGHGSDADASHARHGVRGRASSNSLELMYATYLEKAAARFVFPCFDEPLFKTRFQFAITVPAGRGLTALANTRETGPPVVDRDGNTATFQFAETRHPMSTYLVALAVGRFDYVEAIDSGVRLRVYTPPGLRDCGSWPLDIAVRSVRFFGDMFGLA